MVTEVSKSLSKLNLLLLLVKFFVALLKMRLRRKLDLRKKKIKKS